MEMDLVAQFPESLTFLRKQIRDFARKHFDFTIIDNPPNMGIFVANSLYASDMVIVPIDTGSFYSIDGLRKARELISSVQTSGNPELKFLRLLLNRLDMRKGISRMIFEDVGEWFNQEELFKTSIPFNSLFQESEYERKTIFDYKPKSRSAQAYQKLAKEVVGLCESEFGE